MVKKEMTEEGEVSRYFYVDSQNIFEQQEYWFISINIADVIRKCTVLPLSNEARKQHVFLAAKAAQQVVMYVRLFVSDSACQLVRQMQSKAY